MDKLKEFYIDSLILRRKALINAKNNLKNDKDQSISSIKRIVHLLKGSGSTYGFHEISKLSKLIEEINDDSIETFLTELLQELDNVIQLKEDDEKIGIVIIEDDPTITYLIKEKFKSEPWDVYIAHTAGEATDIIYAKEISLIILDLFLPDIDGRNFILTLKESWRTANIPIMILSAHVGADIKTECFALGADSFFDKPFDVDFLYTQVVNRLHDTKKISELMHKDQLTNIFNRYGLQESYNHLSSLSKRRQTFFSLSIIDLDKFKLINDKYGHGMGDQVLIEFSNLISKALRQSDIFGRWGGEEFVLFLPDTNEEQAKFLINKLRELVLTHDFYDKDGVKFNISFSAGVIELNTQIDLLEAINEADILLYKAKMMGRNCVFSSFDKINTEKLKILIAEDNQFLAKLMKQQFEANDFEVTLSNDGLQTLEYAKKDYYNLLILDVILPSMNGFDILKNIRKIIEYNKTPIVILTAVGKKHDIIQGIKLGANDYMLKPFDYEKLIVKIRKVLRKYDLYSSVKI